MLDSFASRPDPFLFLLVVFPLSLLTVAIAYVLTVRYNKSADDKAEATFGLGQTAIFAVIALILGFSFSFAAQRFEARRDLVVNEAIGIGGSYRRADFLPAPQRDRFHRLMTAYMELRLETYANVGNAGAERIDLDRGKVLQDRLWEIALAAVRSDPRNLAYLNLSQELDEAFDLSEAQTAAIDNHVPDAMMGLVLLSTIAGAALLGLTFGRAKAPHATLSVIFCVLFAATVFTIVDLDNAQGGLIHLDVRALQAQLDDMKQ